MFFKGLPLTIRLNYQTISFKNYLTGGWALKFQAIQDLEWVLLCMDPNERNVQRSCMLSESIFMANEVSRQTFKAAKTY